MENDQIIVTFFRNLGNKQLKLSRDVIIQQWKDVKEKRAIEYKELITENGWSRAELARYLGVSRSWITQVMR